MYPFISLLWDSTDADAAASARRLLTAIRTTLPDYQLALNESGCTVLHRPLPGRVYRPYVLPQRAGVILGRIFPKAAEDWSAGWSWSPSASETNEILRTQGKWLMQQVWGGYVAFLRSPEPENIFVIRDCSGRLPCYRLRHAQVDLIFADPAVLSELGLVPTSINWNYVCAFLCSSQVQIRDTALVGITELLAGDCFQRRSADSLTQYSAWTPTDIFERPLVHQFDTAVQNVRRTANYCIAAWASLFDVILHSLSGGLDSSVVLACLSKCHELSTVVCVNKYGANITEDERSFARLAASKAGVQLIEIPIVAEAQHIDDSLTNLPITVKPTVSGTFGALELLLVNQLARKFKANCIWTGQGGDHLFMQTTMPFGPVDYAALRGFGPGLLMCFHDAVRISKWNYWTVARLFWKKDFDGVAHALARIPVTRQPFITNDVRSRVSPDDLLHPWMHDTSSLPLGQRLQVAALCEVLNRHRPLPGVEATQTHHPLLSQPLFELCLRIPSYVHLRGGLDRAVERAAFTDVLANEIVTRRQKGQSTFSVLDVIHRSKDYLLEILVNGYLVREGVLDRVALEPHLTGRRPIDATSLWPLLSSIAAELWIRNWQNGLRNTASPSYARQTPP